jgi:streptogramin lyase
MRFALAVAVCGGLLLAGCGGGGSVPSGDTTTPPVLPPTANAGGPYTGMVGTPVLFNGAASKDPQSQGLTYSWSFGDGGTCSNPCAAGATPSHTYAQVAGQASSVYTVALTVQDTSGYTGQASTTATIQGVTPLSDAGLTGQVATSSTGISGAHVYLFAANTTGYGQASLPLLSVTETGTSDAVGPYVLTSALGNFSMSGAYTCTSGQQLYLYALGGTAGSQAVPQAGLLAAIGSCPATSSTVVAQVNEVSTVAAAWSLAGFATDAVHVSSSGTALALTGVANAFANAANLVTLSTGVARTANVSGNGTAPQAEINGLANILSVCVNPGNVSFPFVASNCSLLLGDALSVGTTGNTPTDTATAAINIAHNPGANNISDIYDLPNASPYTPTLSRQPNDFTIAVTYTGGGLNGPQGIAIDGSGNAWIANLSGSSVTKISSAGAVLSGTGGYATGGISGPAAIAIDGSGNAWVANQTTSTVTELSSTGTATAGSPYSGGSMHAPDGIAVDGAGNVWVANFGGNSVTELSSAGAATSGSPYSGGGLDQPFGIAIDGSGSAWVTNQAGNSVSKLSSAGAAVSGANGYASGVVVGPEGIAMDGPGNAWVANTSKGTVVEVSPAGSPAPGLNGGGMLAPVAVAIDGSNNVWITDKSASTVIELSSAGAPLSGLNGYTNGVLNGPREIAIDGSGDAWVTNFGGNDVLELIGAATPVVTPIAAGLPSAPSTNGSSKLGSKP